MCGLVTGNVEGIARKKMRALGVLATGALSPPAEDQSWAGEECSAFLGGFGSDYCSADIDDANRNYLDRGEQIRIAASRCRTLLRPGTRLGRVVHVGDAPADVLAARSVCGTLDDDEGRTVVGMVAVATGNYSAQVGASQPAIGSAHPHTSSRAILTLTSCDAPTQELAEHAGERADGVWEPVVLEKGIADAGFLAACGLPNVHARPRETAPRWREHAAVQSHGAFALQG